MDSVGIPSTCLILSTIMSSMIVLASNCDNDGQLDMTWLAPKQLLFHFQLSVTVAVAWTLWWSSPWLKMPYVPLEFWFHLSYFQRFPVFPVLVAILLSLAVLQCSFNFLGDNSIVLAMIENSAFATKLHNTYSETSQIWLQITEISRHKHKMLQISS